MNMMRDPFNMPNNTCNLQHNILLNIMKTTEKEKRKKSLVFFFFRLHLITINYCTPIVVTLYFLTIFFSFFFIVTAFWQAKEVSWAHAKMKIKMRGPKTGVRCLKNFKRELKMRKTIVGCRFSDKTRNGGRYLFLSIAMIVANPKCECSVFRYFLFRF